MWGVRFGFVIGSACFVVGSVFSFVEVFTGEVEGRAKGQPILL